VLGAPALLLLIYQGGQSRRPLVTFRSLPTASRSSLYNLTHTCHDARLNTDGGWRRMMLNARRPGRKLAIAGVAFAVAAEWLSIGVSISWWGVVRLDTARAGASAWHDARDLPHPAASNPSSDPSLTPTRRRFKKATRRGRQGRGR